MSLCGEAEPKKLVFHSVAFEFRRAGPRIREQAGMHMLRQEMSFGWLLSVTVGLVEGLPLNT